MRRSIALAAVVALIGSLALVTAAAGGASSRPASLPFIGIKNVGPIDSTFNDPVFTGWLAAWVETGSASPACLATLTEKSVAATVHELYCSSRTVTLTTDGLQHSGVYLHLLLDEPLAGNVGNGFYVNVYQEGAKFYDEPMLCDMSGCNEE